MTKNEATPTPTSMHGVMAKQSSTRTVSTCVFADVSPPPPAAHAAAGETSRGTRVCMLFMFAVAVASNLTYYTYFLSPAIQDARELYQEYASGIQALLHVDQCAWGAPEMPTEARWITRWTGAAAPIEALWRLSHCADALTQTSSTAAAHDQWTWVARTEHAAADPGATNALALAASPAPFVSQSPSYELTPPTVPFAWTVETMPPQTYSRTTHVDTYAFRTYLHHLHGNLSLTAAATDTSSTWWSTAVPAWMSSLGTATAPPPGVPRLIHPVDQQLWIWRRYWVHQKRALEDVVRQKRRFLEDFLDRTQAVVQNVRASTAVLHWLVWWNGLLWYLTRMWCEPRAPIARQVSWPCTKR